MAQQRTVHTWQPPALHTCTVLSPCTNPECKLNRDQLQSCSIATSKNLIDDCVSSPLIDSPNRSCGVKGCTQVGHWVCGVMILYVVSHHLCLEGHTISACAPFNILSLQTFVAAPAQHHTSSACAPSIRNLQYFRLLWNNIMLGLLTSLQLAVQWTKSTASPVEPGIIMGLCQYCSQHRCCALQALLWTSP